MRKIPTVPLGGKPSETKPKGKTRSSLYRESDTPGTGLYELKRVLPRKGEVERRTEDVYSRMAIWGGTDPAIVKKHHRNSMHQVKVQVATKRATTAKQQHADARREKALALQAQGKTRKQIAAALEITDRGLRKLLKRER
jgi:hypothetical protein